MSARRIAVALAMLLLAPLPAAAENLLKFAVLGVRLGESIEAVQGHFPNVFMQQVDYADPEVGFAYEATLGRREPERIEGNGFVAVEGRDPIELALRFTGAGALYELLAWEKFPKAIDCAAKMRGWRRTYGAPDVQTLDQQIQWIERKLDIERMLEIRCYAEGRVAWRLVDLRALDDYLVGLRTRLKPYLEQAQGGFR